MNNNDLLLITKPLDIFFSTGANYNPWTILNRGTGAGWKNAFNREYATHCGFITHDHGQVMAVEMKPPTIIEDSFLWYLRSKRQERVLCIYRWNGFDDISRLKVLAKLSEMRQARKRYDLFGAIGLNDSIRKLFPRLTRDRDNQDYCSENTHNMLVYAGWNGFIPEEREPHPHKFMTEMRNSNDFSLVYKW